MPLGQSEKGPGPRVWYTFSHCPTFPSHPQRSSGVGPFEFRWPPALPSCWTSRWFCWPWLKPGLFHSSSSMGSAAWASYAWRLGCRGGVCDRGCATGWARADFFSLSGTSKRVWKCPKAIGYASISSLFKRSALVWAVDERPFVLSNLWVPCGLLDTAPHISDLAGQWWLADSGSHSAHVTTSTADSLDETWTLCKVPWALEPAFLGSANPSRCFMWA